MASPKDAFQSTLNDFKKRLTSKEQKDFEFSSLNDVKWEMARIQKEQENVKQMMNFTRIQSFLEAMEQFGKVVEVFLNTTEFLAFVWGPVKFLLQTASTWTDSFDILLDAYEQIGEEIPLLEQYASTFRNHPDMTKQYASSRAKRGDRLRQHRDFVQRQAAVTHYSQYQSDAQELHKHVSQYQQDRILFINRFEAQAKNEKDQKYLSVQEWLSAAQTSLDHEAYCSEREEYPGTGAGKTILASVIIDECVRHQPHSTCYFYCKDNDPAKSDASSVFKGLLRQLLRECRDLVPYCYEKRLSTGDVNMNSSHLAKQILDLFIRRMDHLYIIIDGLDECNVNERRAITSFLNEMVEKCDEYDPGKLRVLFVSQDYVDIEKALANAKVLSLSPSDIESDLKGYVHKWSLKIQGKHEISNYQRDYITESTISTAQGMFLFAKLVMTNLFNQPTKGFVIKELREYSFPKGLEQAYGRIMARIKRDTTDGEWKIAHKLIGWMVCARRPLKWTEIQAAVSMDSEEQTIDFDEGKLRIHIRDLCGSLVQVLPGDRVELVHNTAKMYITTTGIVHEATVQIDLTALCLNYLTFECFDESISDDELRDFTLRGYLAFQDYAVAKWFHHLRCMIDCWPHLPPHNTDAQTALYEIEMALERFCDNHQADLKHHPATTETQDTCGGFCNYSFYENLQRLWNHVLDHQDKDFETRNNVSIEALKMALTRNREVLEQLGSPKTSSKSNIQQVVFFYGSKVYKCPKLTCFYFHEGFKDAKSRDDHVKRHDRPFRCTISDCTGSEFGFTNGKDLEKHARQYHPDTAQQANLFPSVDKTIASKTPFACPVCNKRFTRGFIHRDHMRSHNGDRPFVCPECGKAFTRNNDCKRHEKIHARRQ
ncbi:MAG: hypothetical protein Q9227_004528 [Pyrenula ochraceoflavens]